MTEAPATVETVTPNSEDELAELLAEASASGRRVTIAGGGAHRAMGYPVEPDLVVSTEALRGVEVWEPGDLTLVVRGGTPAAEIESELASGGQTAVLPEQPGRATVGGVVATGSSGYRRLRYGPTRDRILEVRAVTGDGRVIRGGGRVVKNVTGYDLPRLYTGSFGCLGVITSVCLKLWPLTEASATVTVDEPGVAAAIHRPLAILETRDGVTVLLAGTAAEVEDQVARLGGQGTASLQYPPAPTGKSVWSTRVPPADLAETVRRLPAGVAFVAQHGVGEVTVALDGADEVVFLREWAESRGGSVVRLAGDLGVDPWGSPPPGLALQRRLVAAFDPARILEPGHLPGGI